MEYLTRRINLFPFPPTQIPSVPPPYCQRQIGGEPAFGFLFEFFGFVFKEAFVVLGENFLTHFASKIAHKSSPHIRRKKLLPVSSTPASTSKRMSVSSMLKLDRWCW